MSETVMSFQPMMEAKWQAEAMAARLREEEAQRQAATRKKQGGDIIDAEYEVIHPVKGIAHEQS